MLADLPCLPFHFPLGLLSGALRRQATGVTNRDLNFSERFEHCPIVVSTEEFGPHCRSPGMEQWRWCKVHRWVRRWIVSPLASRG